jgi:putative flippase GtrA
MHLQQLYLHFCFILLLMYRAKLEPPLSSTIIAIIIAVIAGFIIFNRHNEYKKEREDIPSKDYKQLMKSILITVFIMHAAILTMLGR